MSEKIKGTVFEIIYKNEDNGFVVAIIDHQGEMVYVKGNIPLIEIGQRMAFIGKFIVDPKYGEQFHVKASEIIIPKDREGIEQLLSSGFIDGVGPAYAEKIVEKFGEETFDVIQYNPAKLKEIRGIGDKKVETIVDSYFEKIAMKEVVLFLQKIGVSLNYATKIYDYYKDKAIEYINKNPYRLADDIEGIGFKLADQIAMKLGLTNDSDYRISSGLKYSLKQGQYNGHTYLEKDRLINETIDLLAVTKEKIVQELENLVIKRVLILEKIEGTDVIYLSHLFQAEDYVADKLFRLKDSYIDYDINIEKEIMHIDQSMNIHLDELQIKAIEESVHHGVTIITGGPGTGKTTIIKSIIDIYKKNELKILLAAPTGRAAKRMEEATGQASQTIHRLLEYQKVDEGFMAFNRTEDNPLIADLIIIDEASMIDILLMKDLLKAITPGTRLILVGDANQLPSVGPGNILEDLLTSEYFTSVRLNKIFRQSDKSLIIKNAHKIIQGEKPMIDNKSKDFFFISKHRPKEILNEIKSLYDHRLKDFFEVDPLHDVQVLTPMKNYVLGTKNINKELQSVVNPKSASKGEKEYFEDVFRVGDKVMQVKNNYDIDWVTDDGLHGSGIYNGDIGFIYGIDTIEQELLINFDGEKHIRYPFKQLDELRLSYAVTVHKSQGNEFPIVVIPMGWIPKPLKRRKILYTAITRAEQAIILIGNINNLYAMVDNALDFERNSGLVYRLKKRNLFYQ